MSCLVCNQIKSNRNFLVTDGDCIDAALDTIRQHYLFFKNSVGKKENELDALQERNIKLTKAVKLLQLEKEQNKNKYFASNSPKKRRKASSLDSSGFAVGNSNLGINVIIDADDDDDDVSIIEPAANLNMALNSEQLLDMSALSASPQPTNKNETIGETESSHSPYHLRTLNEWEQKQQRLTVAEMEVKMDENLNSKDGDENKSAPKKETKSVWNSKLRNDNSTLKKRDSSALFLKPQSGNVSMANNDGCVVNEKKSKLSLRKPSSKLRQSRLLLDAPLGKKSNKIQNDSTLCEAVIDASPSGHANAARSWMLRSGNSSNINVNSSSSEMPPKMNNDDEIFDIFNATEKFNMTENHDHNNLQISSNSSSVVLVTPTPDDVIFLNDTTASDNTEFEKNLLQDVIKIEERLAKDNKMKNKLKPDPVKKSGNSSINQSTLTQHFKVKKEEKLSQQQIDAKENTDKNNTSEEESSEEFLVRPIVVKKEPTTDSNATTSRKISTKDRFNIDCRDCQNYINFLGGDLSDKEIEAHLQHCTRHKESDVHFQQTPDGFWNPLLVSFAEDDPRNEVLIDTRFIGKKRGGT